MNKEQKNKIVPLLRFSKFKKWAGWSYMNGDELFDQVSDKDHNSDLSILAITQEHGAIPREKIDYNITVTDKSVENYKVVHIGDFIISLRSFQGGIEYSDYKGICSPAYIILRRKNNSDVVNGFFKHYFKTKSFIRDLNKNLEGIRDGKMVSYKQFSEIQIPLPKLEEQQKIAECLYTLDDLITAHTQKLEALNVFKKGLMQQLFPAEGENLPRLRFAEFRSSGKWGEKMLGECLMKHPEYGINAPAVAYSKNLPTYLRITDISEEGFFLKNQMTSVEKEVTKDNYLEEGDIVLARTGASVGKSYKYRVEDGELVFAGFLIRIKPDSNKLNSELLFQYLSTDKYWRWVDFTSIRSGQPGINGNEYASLPILLPPLITEQQKIADFLFSLDKLIIMQAEKIEQLKNHKKGLMQGLFPVK